MDYSELVRTLKGCALDDLACALYERDVRTFEETLVALVRRGELYDYEIAARMLMNAPVCAGSTRTSYESARYGTPDDAAYFELLMSACTHCGCAETEYIPMLLSARYSVRGSALRRLSASVDRYIENCARADFERIADIIDAHDKKFGAYTVLIKVDRDRALRRLYDMALHGKKIDKCAVRKLLMDYPEVAYKAMREYKSANAHDRVAVARLLMVFRNDAGIDEFLSDVVANDASVSVREVTASELKSAKSGDAARFFEQLMSENTPLTYAEWLEMFEKTDYAEVADKTFFYLPETNKRGARVLVYNGGEFLDKYDTPMRLNDDEKIYVLHPLDVPCDTAEILDFKINQPFLQISRPVYHLLGGESYYSERLCGTMTEIAQFDAAMKQCGFCMCERRNALERPTAIKRMGDYAVGVEIIPSGDGETVGCGRVAFYLASDVVKINRKLYAPTTQPLDMRTLPRKALSELIYAAYSLFGCD